MNYKLNLITPGESHCIDAENVENKLLISATDLTATTEWQVKPEGFCFESICIPAGTAVEDDNRVDLISFASLTGKPIVINEAEKAASLGVSSSTRSSTLDSLMAPDFSLPDLSGTMHRLSEHRGKKILLAAYASW